MSPWSSAGRPTPQATAQLIVILQTQYHVPGDVATHAAQTFLHNFRLCPDNCDMTLDKWRHLLWSRALGEKYASIAGDVYAEWLRLRYKFLAIAPDVLSLLTKLRQHYLLGLITNGPSNAQWEKVERLNLRNYFDCILVSGDLPWEKPHRNIFLEACHFLGMQPWQCIMVGDKLETDILGGIEASLGATVWVPLSIEHPSSHGPHPDFTINNITDLSHILSSIQKSPTVRSRCRTTFSTHHPVSAPDLEDCCSNSSDGS